ncbi:hypothetical protein [Spirochaeta cellobiosiphila]|uniref:hypothetical protein n=1 Tax=Spirochaeta cellobiosiphila TaxID=504483 RepID=UPI0004083D11|nr:hypothetical protein [Spirochaeta cellobiosiphila]
MPRYSNHHHTSIQSAEKLADTILKKVYGAARKEKWGTAFMQIAWTAGPVTYLGLQGGYYVAYGKTASPEVFIYFAGYTVIAGIFALISKFIYNMTAGDSREEERNSLERVFNLLPKRIAEIRDLQLTNLDEKGRNILGAKYLLENPDADAYALATAMYDLTNDLEISEIMAHAETYRQNGLLSRAKEKRERIKILLEPHMEQIKASSEEVTRLILNRVNGVGPDKNVGRMRTRGFISRVLSAAENDDLNLMTLSDSEEVCILAFELICSRQYPYFHAHYIGHKAYTIAAKRLEIARREYGSAIYKRNSYLRILAERLYRESAKNTHIKGIHKVIASLPNIRSSQILQEKIVATLKENIHNKSYSASKLRADLDIYQRLRRAGLKTKQAHKKFQTTWINYVKMLQEMDRSEHPLSKLHLMHKKNKGKGVYLTEKSIGLHQKQIIPMVQLFEQKLEEFTLEHETAEVKVNDQKELAVDLLLIIDKYIPLSPPRTQRTIEDTRSAYLNYIFRDTSISMRQPWGLSLISGIKYSRQQAIHSVISRLIEYDRLKLTKEDIPYLIENYDGDMTFLEEQMNQEQQSWTSDFDIPEPIVVPVLNEIKRQDS